MSVRKSQGRQRGIQRGVPRHKLGGRPRFSHGSKEKTRTVSGLKKARLPGFGFKRVASQWAERSFYRAARICCIFCLIPFTMDDKRSFTVAPFWRVSVHALIMVFLFVTCFQKLILAIVYFVGQFDTNTVAILSYTGFQIQITALCSGMSIMFMPFLSCELLNSWRVMLWEVASRLDRPICSPWSSLSFSVQMLSTCVGAVVTALSFPLLSFMFPMTPSSVFRSLSAAGLIDNVMDTWILLIGVWFVCYVTDVAMYGACLSLMTFVTGFVMAEVGVLKTLLNELR